MALPKRKFSKARRDKRRTHWKLKNPNLIACPQCGKLKLPHRVCPYCGYYRNRQVVVIEEKQKEK
ncbi:MAG: 50S ribosomal protein L32 [Candidatus Omnitrophota bacterium]